MITYAKTGGGLHLLVRLYGSALPRALPFAALSAGLTAALYGTKHRQLAADWSNPYPYQVFAAMLGFVVVFRTNFSYTRYWEGRTQLQAMTASWLSLVAQALSFDRPPACEDKQAAALQAEQAARFGAVLEHSASLLHALALQHLRGDWRLRNLAAHSKHMAPPPLDAAGVKAHGLYTRLSWMDFFVLRGSTERRQRYNAAMPLPVIGELSQGEEEELGQGLEALKSFQTETLIAGRELSLRSAMRVARRGWLRAAWEHTFLLSTGVYVPGAAERVYKAYGWANNLLTDRARAGGLHMAPPSRPACGAH